MYSENNLLCKKYFNEKYEYYEFTTSIISTRNYLFLQPKHRNYWNEEDNKVSMPDQQPYLHGKSLKGRFGV